MKTAAKKTTKPTTTTLDDARARAARTAEELAAAEAASKAARLAAERKATALAAAEAAEQRTAAQLETRARLDARLAAEADSVREAAKAAARRVIKLRAELAHELVSAGAAVAEFAEVLGRVRTLCAERGELPPTVEAPHENLVLAWEAFLAAPPGERAHDTERKVRRLLGVTVDPPDSSSAESKAWPWEARTEAMLDGSYARKVRALHRLDRDRRAPPIVLEAARAELVEAFGGSPPVPAPRAKPSAPEVKAAPAPSVEVGDGVRARDLGGAGVVIRETFS